MEKSQDSTGEQQTAAAPAAKGKKGKETKAPPQQQKRLPFLPPKLNDAEMLKALTSLKAVTTYSASRALGVNSSIAASILKGLESKAMLKRQGGFSGHTVWSVVQAS